MPDDVGELLPLAPRQSGIGRGSRPVFAGVLHGGSVFVVDTHLHGGADALRDVGRDALAGLHRAMPGDPNEVALQGEETVREGAVGGGGGGDVHGMKSYYFY